MNEKRYTERVESRMTRWGAWVSGMSLIITAVGSARNDDLLASFGLAGFILLGMSYCVGRLNLRGWVMNAEGAASTHVREVYLLRLKVESQKRCMSGYGLRVRISMLGEMKDEWTLPRLDPDEEHTRDVKLIPAQRAHGRSHVVCWQSLFPLGLWGFERVGEMIHHITIFPHVARVRVGVLMGATRDAAVLHGRSFGRSGGEWRGLRAWQAGDSLQRIHASASSRSHARGTGLMVCEYDPPGHLPQRVMVLFHSFGRDSAIIRPEIFEQALSNACGVLKFLVTQSIPVTFVADFDHFLEHRCDSNAQLIEIFHILSRAKRFSGTEIHDLEKVKNDSRAEDFWIIISDMNQELWREVFSALSGRCQIISPKGGRKK